LRLDRDPGERLNHFQDKFAADFIPFGADEARLFRRRLCLVVSGYWIVPIPPSERMIHENHTT
jgi:hypothetical protein